jgi:excisionase family DNA binding protein
MAIQIIQDSEEFESRIELKLHRFESSLISKLKKEFQPKKPEEFLTRSEASALLKVTVTTLDRWTDQGKLQRYGLGNRILYKRSEIEKSIIRLK